MSDSAQGFGNTSVVPTRALWGWSTPTDGSQPVVLTYPTTGGPTKTGLMPADLAAFIGIPMQIYGNPPTPIPDATVLRWIRFAEDQVERETTILLCQTWVASPPVKTAPETSAVGLGTVSGIQRLGVDYDIEDSGYDFMFDRAQDNGWMVQQLRYRPIKSLIDSEQALKNLAYIYPLLSTFFRVPPTWMVEDQDYGLIRVVPSTNVQMLPLFAVQLSVMGFADSVPQGLWFQYTAGLTPNDYNSSYSFMLELVLTTAAIRALTSIQLSVNFGALETQMAVDGLNYKTRYDPKGAFAGPIAAFEAQRKALMKTARTKVSGIVLTTL
jgi:hypothetical protein